MTKEIQLSQGKVALVDADDYDNLCKYKWHAVKSPKRKNYWRACRVENYKTISMHSEILQVPDDKFIDHINHNPLDNRKANLRECTITQNNWNTRPYGKTSNYKGVYWHTRNKRWRATVWKDGRQIFLGNFVDEHDAARAYNKAVLELRDKEFTYLNDVPPKEGE